MIQTFPVNTHQNEAHIISEGGSRNAYITGNVTFVYKVLCGIYLNVLLCIEVAS